MGLEVADEVQWVHSLNGIHQSDGFSFVLLEGLILNGMSDPLFDIYQNVESSKELWDSLKAKYMAEDTSSKKFLVSCIIDKCPLSWNDFKHTLKHHKEELTLVKLGSHLHIEESFMMQDNDKPKGNNIAGPSVVNTMVHNNSFRYNNNKGKHKHHDTKTDPNKKSKVTFWKCGKLGHLKKDCKSGKVGNKANGSGTNGSVDSSTNSLKGQNMFNKSLQVYYVTYVSEANFVQDDDVAWWIDSGATVLNSVIDNIGSAFMSTSKLNDLILWHARLGHVHYKRIQDMSKDGLISAFDMDTKNDLYDLHDTPSLENNKYFVTFIDDASRFCYVYLLHTKDEALDKFKVFKTEVELQQGSLIKRFRTDRGGLSQRFWGEAMAVARLHDLKQKTLGERSIECIFVRYVEHSKAFRFFVIEPNESVSINSIIESMDDIFNENRFSSVLGPSQRSLIIRTKDIGDSVVLDKVTEEVVQQLRKGKRIRTPINFGPEFKLYLIKGTMDEVSNQHSYCFNVEDDPNTFDEAMKSQDVAFWEEAINDDMDSIMGNNTWVLADLPPGCKPLGCKWIFKRKLKVDGTIENFKARLVIQGFRKKSGIDYFDTYALVARISTIRLLIDMASIHNLIIH
ncbi:zinc finger, CCHC-type containing protein [Tanacetum coccineum]